MKSISKSLEQLQASALERARAIEIMHADSLEVFELVHDARQKAATFAQRRYEDAHGLPHGLVPLQAEIPDRHPRLEPS